MSRLGEAKQDGEHFVSDISNKGRHCDIYQTIHSNYEVYQAARKEQLREYVKQHQLAVRYYQDYGWPPVELD